MKEEQDMFLAAFLRSISIKIPWYHCAADSHYKALMPFLRCVKEQRASYRGERFKVLPTGVIHSVIISKSSPLAALFFEWIILPGSFKNDIVPTAPWYMATIIPQYLLPIFRKNGINNKRSSWLLCCFSLLCLLEGNMRNKQTALNIHEYAPYTRLKLFLHGRKSFRSHAHFVSKRLGSDGGELLLSLRYQNCCLSA